MAPPTTRTLSANKQSLPAPPCTCSDDDDVVRQLVMGRWRCSLSSGLRAALACTIVGLVSLYAPAALRRHITFPAFSYVVTVILVTDATVGTALRGAVSALHGTLMGVPPSVAALWLAHRSGAAESVVATSAVVALTAFAVALPESVGPVAKRIALGQAIIIYVARFQRGERLSRALALLHPANVVACTALGVAAALLAVLLPWPRLATREARDKVRAYNKVAAAERVRVLADAFTFAVGAEAEACSRQRRRQMAACLSEANRLATASRTVLNRINAIKEDLQWERAMVVVDDSIEMPLTGMQMALATMQQEADGGLHGRNQQQVGLVMAMRDQIRLALLTPSNKSVCYDLPTLTNYDDVYHEQQLAPFLFIFSLYHLHRCCCGGNDLLAKQQVTTTTGQPDDEQEVDEVGQDNVPSSQAEAAGEDKHQQARGHRRLAVAAKCGFSLGLAVLLGLLLSNDHGFWSGLIVATTMTAGRESTWAVAMARAHGTALGSVYGVLGCLLMSQQQLLLLRFVGLILPWMVLAAFLKRSRAYGPAGGVAAALSVVIIMGRRYHEAPMPFTIARLVETFIGISCAVLADLVFQPGARPSVRAREQLVRCVAGCRRLVVAKPNSAEILFKRVQQEQALLSKYAAEASGEPTYLWLPPFPASCYDKIQGSLRRMAQLLQLYHQAFNDGASLCHLSSSQQLQRFSSLATSSLSQCLHMLLAVAPPSANKDARTPNVDLEAAAAAGVGCGCCYKDDQVLGSLSRELLFRLNDDSVQQQEETRFLLLCCLGSITLCMREILKEAQQLEAHILDLNNLQLISTH